MSIRMQPAALCAMAIIMAAGMAFAHRVNVFAWVEGDTVRVECKFSDGTKVRQGVIRVFDSGGAEILNGKTTDGGKFSFKAPAPDDLKIVLEAGMGHRAEWRLSTQDFAP